MLQNSEAGIEPSVGSKGDSYDNALAETMIGLYKTELIDTGRTWTDRGHVERETAAYIHWFNTERLHSSLGYCSPIEYETRYRDTVASEAEVA